jgi:hypothetical protein
LRKHYRDELEARIRELDVKLGRPVLELKAA